MRNVWAVALILAPALGGCVSLSQVREPVRIAISRGPCFGFCPVYEILTEDQGEVRFQGIRHTAFLGTKTKFVGADAIAGVATQLDPFRPRQGSSDFACPTAVSDQATYTIRWLDPQSRPVAALSFNSGCQSVEGAALRSLLESIPRRLDLAEEAGQMTRPNASRG